MPRFHDDNTVAKNFQTPNGICFSPDETVLYISDSVAAQIRVFDVLPDNTCGGVHPWESVHEP